MNKKYVSAALGVTASIAMIVPAFAENTPTTNNGMRDSNRMMRRGGEQEGRGLGNGQMTRPVVTGTVTAVSGNTITLSGNAGMMSSSTPKTTFTIDATNAKVLKAGKEIKVATIVTGDTLAVSGTLTGTNVVATIIHDGIMMGGRGGDMKNNAIKNDAQAMQQLQGNGQPVVAGNVTAINGSTITVTNKSNVTYTADTSAAKVLVSGVTSTLASVKVGDSVVVQGTVNGTAITASTVIDNGTPRTIPTTNTTGQPENQGRMGFFGGIGSFFGKMFGF